MLLSPTLTPDPIAPKSNAAFYGAAKIDNLFLFYKSRCLVSFQGPVILVEFLVSVAWKVHAESGECLDLKLAHEFRSMSLVQDTVVESLMQCRHLIVRRSGIHDDAFEVVEPMMAASVISLNPVGSD